MVLGCEADSAGRPTTPAVQTHRAQLESDAPMIQLLGASAANVAVDVSLAFSGFFVGLVGAIAYYRLAAKGIVQPGNVGAAASPEAAANNAARSAMAAQQLRDLAKNVASDVGAHNTLVEGITDQLAALQGGDQGNGAVVMEAVTKMLEANKKLSMRLEDAEQKIQVQAEEIRLQQSEARTDALTQLANRRAFDACLDENIERFRQSAQPFSMLLMDVDHFKQFNDVHGHPAGDEVLRCVGQTLARVVKAGDLACRYGGEEFAVIMSNTKCAEGQVAAERVRQAIEAMQVNFDGQVLRVTASLGLSASQAEDDSDRIVRRADDAVYASKKAGRNRCHWHNSAEPVPIAKAGEAASKAIAEPKIVKKLPDRAVFTDELRRRIAETQRSGAPVSVLHYRVKDYAALENSYGNAVGELLLDALAIFIRSTLRDMDLLGKLSPGEFVVMLPGTSRSAAKIVGQRVKTSISLCPIPLGEQQIRLQLDMGVASVHADDDAASVLAHAKQDLETASAAELSQNAELAPA